MVPRLNEHHATARYRKVVAEFDFIYNGAPSRAKCNAKPPVVRPPFRRPLNRHRRQPTRGLAIMPAAQCTTMSPSGNDEPMVQHVRVGHDDDAQSVDVIQAKGISFSAAFLQDVHDALARYFLVDAPSKPLERNQIVSAHQPPHPTPG
jgi:hypothetical protein